MGKIKSAFLGMEIELDEIERLVSTALACPVRLVPLSVKCTYPVFCGETAGDERYFVKIGTIGEWSRTASLLETIGERCPAIPRFATSAPLTYRGYAVFVSEWKEAQTVFPEQMTDSQIASFVSTCEEIVDSFQDVQDFTPIADSPFAPEELYDTLLRYVRHHPHAGRLLTGLVELPPARRTYADRKLTVLHGDFHAKNFAYSGETLSAIYDFDQLTEGLPCGDFVNALVERFSCLGLSGAVRSRLRCAARRAIDLAPWPREDMAIACNVLRLRFAVRRIEKHSDSAWVAVDILRRDRRIREFLRCL